MRRRPRLKARAGRRHHDCLTGHRLRFAFSSGCDGSLGLEGSLARGEREEEA